MSKIIEPQNNLTSEQSARVRYFWSKVRQSMKGGEIETAAEWVWTAKELDGWPVALAVCDLAGQLSRGEIER